jgi:uncharacterized damage-inducible protein DinB
MLLNQTDLLNQLKGINDCLIKKVEKDWKQIPEEKLNQRPAPKSWSVLECLDHLNKAHSVYRKQYGEILGEKKTDSNRGDFMKPTWLGKKFFNMMQPREDYIPSKMPTGKPMKPDTELGKADRLDKNQVIEEFLSMQRNMNTWLENAKERDLQSYKVQTALPLIKMRLGDSLRFIMAHTERHILQGEKALKQVS